MRSVITNYSVADYNRTGPRRDRLACDYLCDYRTIALKNDVVALAVYLYRPCGALRYARRYDVIALRACFSSSLIRVPSVWRKNPHGVRTHKVISYAEADLYALSHTPFTVAVRAPPSLHAFVSFRPNFDSA